MPDLFTSLLGRRTHKRFDGNPIDRDRLTELLGYGMRAPQHRMHHPWRFTVLDQGRIALLGRWLLEATAVISVPNPDKGQRKAHKLVDHYFPQLGAMILVTQLRHADPQIDLEDHAAVAAAVQNILLAAEGHGLAAFWNSSQALQHPDTLRHLGRDPEQERFVASIWLGGRVEEPPVPAIDPLETCTTWLQGSPDEP